MSEKKQPSDMTSIGLKRAVYNQLSDYKRKRAEETHSDLSFTDIIEELLSAVPA